MTIWFFSNEFINLPITGKIAAIAGFALVILLITLLDISLAKRHVANRLPTNELPKNCPDDNSTPANRDYMPQRSKGWVIWHSLLGKILSNWGKDCIHHQPKYDGDTYNQPSLEASANPSRTIATFSQSRHIRIIVNWLGRLVNHSGKEP